jgi:hypothetical protein
VRGTLFALYPGEVDAQAMDQDFRGMVSRIGQGGSLELKGVTPSVLATAEAGGARYSDSLDSSQLFVKGSIGFRPWAGDKPWRDIFFGPVVQASEYRATVPGQVGQPTREIKDRDLRAVFLIGGALPF